MKVFKTILLAAMLGSAMSVYSTAASAEASDGRIVYAPREAIDLVIKKIDTALGLATSGGDAEQIASAAKDALDGSKEINANDKVDIARGRANGVLKQARAAAKAGNIPEAEQLLRKALHDFEALKGLL